MKKNSAMAIILGCMCLALIATSAVNANDAELAVDQLASELQGSGVITQREANAIKSPLRNMARRGASKKDLKDFVTDLSNKGVKGDDLTDSVNSINDLVNKGENPKEAGSVVSRAAAQAHADGLKGKDLAAKVHEAIAQRKAQKDEAKNKSEKVKAEKVKVEKVKAEKAKKAAQEKTKKIEKGNQQKNKNKGK